MQLFMKTCCTCNKSIEKHVLGTASTAGTLFLFDLGYYEFKTRPMLEVTIIMV